jgi:hypothetical protein
MYCSQLHGIPAWDKRLVSDMGYGKTRDMISAKRCADPSLADTVGDDSYTFENWLPFFEKSIHYTPPDMSKRSANATPDVDLSTLGDAYGPLSLTFSNWAQAASSYVQKGFAELGILPINGKVAFYAITLCCFPG